MDRFAEAEAETVYREGVGWVGVNEFWYTPVLPWVFTRYTAEKITISGDGISAEGAQRMRPRQLARAIAGLVTLVRTGALFATEMDLRKLTRQIEPSGKAGDRSAAVRRGRWPGRGGRTGSSGRTGAAGAAGDGGERSEGHKPVPLIGW